MFPPFSQKEANLHCKIALSLLEKNALLLEQVSKESEERKNQGVMLGCLICEKKDTKEKVILLAISGISKKLSVNKNFFRDFDSDENTFFYENQKYIITQPLVSPKEIENALSEHDKEIHELTDLINQFCENQKKSKEYETLIEKRNSLCNISLKKVYDLYSFTTFSEKKVTLNKIILDHQNKLPPTGTGECCAPKLLCHAFSNKLQPLSMDEIYIGQDTLTKKNGQSYPPCDERCGFILPHILGLEILYQDSQIVVINKASGLLSIPGRTEDKKDSVTQRLKQLYPFCIEQPSVHRLDMETSGLLVLALTKEAHRDLSIQFQQGLVKKQYIAILDGSLYKATGEGAPKNGEKSGHIELKFRLDVENRPHQIYDEENGKLGITDWKLLDIFSMKTSINTDKRTVTKVLFTPLTGRTHQLRLVSSDIHGFNLPIVGDTLYGNPKPGERLLLHSCFLEFSHPQTKQKMTFTCPPEF